MSTTDSDEDAPTGPQGADRYPSAQVLIELGALLAKPKSKDRALKAWRAVTAAAGNPDFHAVLDFAMENQLVSGCEPTDPRGANTHWTNPTDGSEMVWIPAGKFVYGPEDKPAECDGFSLGRYPVTNEQFQAFVGATGYT